MITKTDHLYKQIEKLVFSIDNNWWETRSIIPKIKLELHPDGDKFITDINNLKPNPTNDDFYSPEEIEESAKELAFGIDEKGTHELCMNHRLNNGLIVNHEAIKICPITGVIWSGHTRYNAALMVGAKYVYVVYAEYVYSTDIPDRECLNILHQYNLYKRPEQTIKQQVNKTKKLVSIICKSNPVSESSVFDPYCWNRYFKNELMKLQESFLNKKSKNASYIKNIIRLSVSKDCYDIVSKIDDGELALNVAMKELRSSIKKQYTPNPDRYDFVKFIKEHKKEWKELYKDYFSQAHNNLFNKQIIKTKKLGEINIITDKKFQKEKPKKTADLSDIVMSTTAILFSEFDFDCTTAGVATNSADVQFPTLTLKARKKNPDYPEEEIEVKCATVNNNDAIFYGGPDMKKHIKYYMFKVFNSNFTKCFSFATLIDGPTLVKTGGKGKDSCTLNLKSILSHHKNDIEVVYGAINEYSYDMEII